MFFDEHLLLSLHHDRARELRADAGAERLARSVLRTRRGRGRPGSRNPRPDAPAGAA